MKRYSNTISERTTGRHKLCILLANDLNGKAVLNIGCSIGWYEKYAVENRCQMIVGVDTDYKSIINANKTAEQANFILSTATGLPFKDNSFDVVTMFDVIEHVPQNTEPQCLEEIRRVLNDHGALIISTPNDHLLANIFDPAWYLGHRHYSHTNLAKMLTHSGFRIESMRYGGGFFEITSMFLLYVFKWIFKSEIPWKTFFDNKREKEYSGKKGFVTLFSCSRK